MRLRRLLAIVGAALAVPAIALADGTSYQANPAHDGHVDDPALTVPLTAAWSRELEGPPSFPLVAGGRVFVIARGTLYALDRATGRTLWRRAVAAPSSNLAYEGGRLFVATTLGLTQAIDAASGASLWAIRTGTSIFNTMPVAAGGRVFVINGGSGTYAQALDAAAGTRLWRVGVGSASYPPAVVADRLYLSDGRQEFSHGTADGVRRWSSVQDPYGDGAGIAPVHAGRVWNNRGQVLDAATGAKLRDYRSSRPPAFAGSLAVLVDGGALVAQDEATGEQRWVRPLSGGVAGQPLVVGSTVFAVSGSGRVEAVDALTGAPLGRIALGGEPVGGLGAGDGTLVVSTREGVTAFAGAGAVPGDGLPAVAAPPLEFDAPGAGDDARAFQQDAAHSGALAANTPAAPLRKRWSLELDAPDGALIADGKVFTISTGGSTHRLLALDARDGSELWSVRLPGNTNGRHEGDAAYDAGRVFVISSGRLYAYDAATGEQLWVSASGAQAGPIAFGGNVYVATYRALTALRQVDGVQQWEYAASNGGAPASDGTRVWMSYACGWLAVAIASRAKVAIATNCNADHVGPRTAVGEGVFVQPDEDVALDAATGALRDAIDSNWVPAFAHGLRFTTTAGALDASPAAGGPLRWRFTGDGGLYAPPLVVGRQVFVASEAGRLFAVDADSGARVWTGAVGDETRGDQSLFAGEGLLVVPSRKRLTAYESAGGPPAGADATPQTTLAALPAPVRERDPLLSFSADQTGFFDCRLDGGPWTPCTSPHRLVGLVDAKHVFEVRAVNADGVGDPTPARSEFTVDAPPNTSAYLGRSETKDPRAPISIQAFDPPATFECRLDGGAWTACTSTFTPAAPLPDGPHFFEARAIDAAGQRDPTPATVSWTVDTVAPAGLTISSPSGTVNTPTPQLSGKAGADGVQTVRLRVYYGTELLEERFEIDAPVSGGAYSVPAFRLDDGTYTLQSRQLDGALNAAVVTSTFTVATAEPDTFFSYKPWSAEAYGTAHFSIYSSHKNAAFECRLDGAAWAACPGSYSLDVDEGTHTLDARAISGGTRDATPVSWTWRVDSTGPRLTVNTPGGGGDPTPLLSGTSDQPGELGVYVDRESGGSEAYNLRAQVRADGTWELESTALRDGTYTVRVFDIDELENEGHASSGMFTIAAAWPGTLLDSDRHATVVSSHGFQFHSTVDGARFECRLDGGPWEACSSPWTAAGLTDGKHEASIRAVDGTGRVDQQPIVHRFTADGTAPVVSIDAPADGAVSDSPTPRITGRADEATPMVVEVRQFQRATGASFTPVTRRVSVTPVSGAWTADITGPLPPGRYEVTATQQDALGNTGSAHLHDLWISTAPQTTPAPGTPGPTPTPTATWEGEPGATPTASPTPSATPSPTPTASPTPTPAATASPTPTATATASPTPMATASPAATASPDPAATAPLSPEPAAAAAPALRPALLGGLPAPKPAPASPAQLSRAARVALRARPSLPLRLAYRSARPGTLTVRVRDARTRRVVGRARVAFVRAGEKAVVVRGGKLPRKTVVEVRFVR